MLVSVNDRYCKLTLSTDERFFTEIYKLFEVTQYLRRGVISVTP